MGSATAIEASLDPLPLTIAGREFRSRLMVGTGKYASNALMIDAIEASGAEVVTVAVRRVDLDRANDEGILHHLDPEKFFLLANTAGCYSADEAIRYSRLARAAGWNAEGLELNPKTAAYAAQRSGAPVHQGNIHTFTPAGCYDAVTLTDVLEHVPRPLEVLTRARAYICPGGWLAIKVPNGPAQRVKETLRAHLRPSYRATLADNLVHVNHFSAASLARALSAAGFRDVTVMAAAPELPGDGATGRLSHLGRLSAYRVARALPGGAASPLAFNLQAYGRRD